MKSRGSVVFGEWVEAQGGVRAAGRELGKPAETLRRWAAGERVPSDDDRTWLEQRTGTPRGAWDVADLPVVAAKRAPKKAPEPAPPAPSPSVRPARAAVAPQAPPPYLSLPPSEVPPATVSELQARLRQIPGELAELRAGVRSGDVAITAAETLRRLLEGEARSLAGAITASGTATVEEVEGLRALVLDATKGCEACRARMVAALREMGR